MHTLLNLMWFFSGRFKESLRWGGSGVAQFRKITGIPVGLQHFKFANMLTRPFGRKIVHKVTFGTVVLNAYWLLSNGFELAIAAVLKGFWLCLTVIGIPFGRQWFKFAKLALFPFGSRVVRIDGKGQEKKKKPKSKAGKILEEIEDVIKIEEEHLLYSSPLT